MARSDTYATSSDFGGKLAQALNLDMTKVRRIIFDIEAGELARVGVEYFMRNREGDEMLEVLVPYYLTTEQPTDWPPTAPETGRRQQPLLASGLPEVTP